MVRTFATLMLVFSLAVFGAPSAEAQNSAGSTKATGPRKQVATIIFAGLAGAVLGLSTLSFYGRPQDRLSNIAVGFAVGVIIGATYTTYKAATDAHSLSEGENDRYRQLDPEVWRVAGETKSLMGSAPSPELKFQVLQLSF